MTALCIHCGGDTGDTGWDWCEHCTDAGHVRLELAQLREKREKRDAIMQRRAAVVTWYYENEILRTT